jgi:hypothetical protein
MLLVARQLRVITVQQRMLVTSGASGLPLTDTPGGGRSPGPSPGTAAAAALIAGCCAAGSLGSLEQPSTVAEASRPHINLRIESPLRVLAGPDANAAPRAPSG